jgi:hypothetical protein
MELQPDSALGGFLLKSMASCRAKIPAAMEQFATNLDMVPYDITINYSSGPMPHHADEDKYDGPFGLGGVLSVNEGAMAVFGEYGASTIAIDGGAVSNPDIRHKWLGPCQFMAFADKLRTVYDHGMYPIPKDAHCIPDVLEVGMSATHGVRASHVYRWGDTTPEQTMLLAATMKRASSADVYDGFSQEGPRKVGKDKVAKDKVVF